MLNLYVLEFLFNGERRKMILAPASADIANGVIMSSQAPDSDVMVGNVWGGGTIEVPIQHIFSIDLFKVTLRPGWFGNGARTVVKNENQIADIVSNTADPKTGEGRGISKIVNLKTKEVVYDRDEKPDAS